MDLNAKKPIFWFDMDGVLARYDYGLYLPPESGFPRYLLRQEHMFRNMEPDRTAISLFTDMYGRYLTEKPYYVRTLTGIPRGLLQAEHTIDKYLWMLEKVTGFKQDDFFCVSVEKHSAVATDLWKLTALDILIDDYNKNLDDWKAHGGTPVKYVNGINSPRNDMPNLSHDMHPSDMRAALELLAESLRKRHGKYP